MANGTFFKIADYICGLVLNCQTLCDSLGKFSSHDWRKRENLMCQCFFICAHQAKPHSNMNTESGSTSLNNDSKTKGGGGQLRIESIHSYTIGAATAELTTSHCTVKQNNK